jgi:hypothetical protein
MGTYIACLCVFIAVWVAYIYIYITIEKVQAASNSLLPMRLKTLQACLFGGPICLTTS